MTSEELSTTREGGPPNVAHADGILNERETRIWQRYRIEGVSQRVIAEEEGISQPRVSQILMKARGLMPRQDLTEVRNRVLAVHQEVIERALSLAEMQGAPVTAGKDGDVVYDPEGGGVVRDYAGNIAAYRLALDAMKQLRAVEGMDAATKTETSATVRYVVEGVDTEALK